jgi:hypothetical protein
MGISALLMAGLGGYAAYRALWRAQRSVLHTGAVVRCAGGDGCDPAVVLQSDAGQSRVYTPVSGTVMQVGPGAQFTLLARRQPALLEFRLVGGPTEQLVADGVPLRPGQRLSAGQQIGTAVRVRFAVYQVGMDQGGAIAVGNPYEPATWLASMGARLVSKLRSTGQWCEGPRRFTVPERALLCNMKLGEPPRLALLPISATVS